MTADDRRRIREAIDAHQRARRAKLIAEADLFTCNGCGCDSETYTSGCDTCRNRQARRRMWATDPEGMRAKDRARKRRSRAKAAT